MSNLPPDQADKTDEAASDREVEDRIAAILADPSIPATEKRARLDGLLESLGIDPTDGEDNAPLEAQILHAVSLLAEGGHDYSRTESDDGKVPVVNV